MMILFLNFNETNRIKKNYNLLKLITFLIINLMTVNLIANSADFEKGLNAAQSGDFETALYEWLPLAENGDSEAQYSLGLIFYDRAFDDTYGEPEDDKNALYWFKLAANQGHVRAQTNLGLMYDKGYGVDQNYFEAEKWYLLAASQGSKNAQFNLGQMYRRGEGGKPNYVKAIYWYKLAAEQGDADAQSNLGVMYLNISDITIRSYREAVKWFKLASEQGHAKAQFNLASMYYFGKGVKKNLDYAYMWGSISYLNGNKNGSKIKKMVSKKLSSSHLENIEKWVLDCVNNNYQECSNF